MEKEKVMESWTKVGNVEDQDLWRNSDFVHINKKWRKPWAAVITGVEGSEVNRYFLEADEWDERTPLYDLKKYKGKVLEFNGGSGKNEYRAYLYIDTNGDIYEICEGTTKQKATRDAIKQALQATKEIPKEELIAEEIKKIEQRYGVKLNWRMEE